MDPAIIVILFTFVVCGIAFFFLLREEKKAELETIARQMRKQQKHEDFHSRITYYKNSPLMPEIIHFLVKDGMPFCISLDYQHISASHISGKSKSYSWSSHGIELDRNELHILAHAINQTLGNNFEVKIHRFEGDLWRIDLEGTLRHF